MCFKKWGATAPTFRINIVFSLRVFVICFLLSSPRPWSSGCQFSSSDSWQTTRHGGSRSSSRHCRIAAYRLRSPDVSPTVGGQQNHSLPPWGPCQVGSHRFPESPRSTEAETRQVMRWYSTFFGNCKSTEGRRHSPPPNHTLERGKSYLQLCTKRWEK